jgi:DNA-binding SARP family transcriptional activator
VERWASRSSVRWPWTARDVSVRVTVSCCRPWPCAGAHPVTTDELTDALWGDSPPASAHKNLQSCIVRLRKALGSDAIETTDDGYRLTGPVGDLDAQRFESEMTKARELLALGEVDRAAFLLQKALHLWRGPAFPELVDWPPARREAGRLEELRRDAEELLLDAQLRGGRAREALPRAHEMVRAAPLRERRWELLALAQYRTGAQGEALRTIRQLRTVLARELGIDPAPEVVALEQSILRQDPELQHDEAVAALPTCPWQGLQAYDVTEADRFFGREEEIEACLAILDRHGLLALVGPSGSGKSSLMRAGIGARLRQRGAALAVLTPGRYPSRALSALTAAGDGDALLVDQAEESGGGAASRGRGAACGPPGRPDRTHCLQSGRRARDVPRRRSGRGGPPLGRGGARTAGGAAARARPCRPPRHRGA